MLLKQEFNQIFLLPSIQFVVKIITQQKQQSQPWPSHKSAALWSLTAPTPKNNCSNRKITMSIAMTMTTTPTILNNNNKTKKRKIITMQKKNTIILQTNRIKKLFTAPSVESFKITFSIFSDEFE